MGRIASHVKSIQGKSRRKKNVIARIVWMMRERGSWCKTYFSSAGISHMCKRFFHLQTEKNTLYMCMLKYKIVFLFTHLKITMPTNSSLLRDKLKRYNKPFIEKSTIEQTIKKFAPGYTIADLCNRKFITPIKKDKVYVNLLYERYINPYIVGALYFGDKPYVFGWIDIYNKYHFTTQIAEWRVIYNTEILGEKVIAWCKFIFKKVRPSFFYGIKKQKIDGYTINIMSAERALIELYKTEEEPEFITKLPDNVDVKKLIKLASTNVSKNILHRLLLLTDDKKIHKKYYW